MDKLKYIDIKDEKTIDGLICDKDNFAFDAFKSESLDAWMPDIGLTDHPRRSVYRSKTIKESCVSSWLRHRFWDDTSHVGKKYIGVVLYDKLDEDFTLQFKLRDEDIGEISTIRKDNRRHLLVITKPVEFIGGMEVFQIWAKGGECRLETIVLLNELPEAHSYKPEIKRITANPVITNGYMKSAKLSFTTSEPSRITIKVVKEDNQDSLLNEINCDDYNKLHSYLINDLSINEKYVFTITAFEKQGECSVCDFPFEHRDTIEDKDDKIVIPIEIFNNSETKVKDRILTFGVPIPKGMLHKLGSCYLTKGSTKRQVQTRIISKWTDGSIRWILADSLCPNDIDIDEDSSAALEIECSGNSNGGDMLCLQDEDKIIVQGRYLRTIIYKDGRVIPALFERKSEHGHWEPFLNKNGFDISGLETVLGSGRTLRQGPCEEIKIEESGSVKTVIKYRVPLVDDNGVVHFTITFRIFVYNDEKFIKTIQRFEVCSPLLGSVSGQLYNETKFDEADGEDDERSSIINLSSAAVKLSLSEYKSIEIEGKKIFESNAKIAQLNDISHVISSQSTDLTVDGRAYGTVIFDQEKSKYAIAIKDFWETYPKAISVEDNVLRLEFFPRLTQEPLPGDEDAWHRLYFWNKKGLYRLKLGMAFTTEYVIASAEAHSELTETIKWALKPPFIKPSIDWFNKTKVMSYICPKIETTMSEYEQAVDEAYNSWMNDREVLRQYGFINYGDWYGESGWSWGNNEYDPTFAAYVEFLRGGNKNWAIIASQAARHLTDVDTVNFSCDKKQIGAQYMHMPGHAGGYLPPFFRSKISGSRFVHHHMWAEGPILHYLLTGDETAKETIDKIASYVINGTDLNYYDFGNCRYAGWHITHLCALAQIYDDPTYLNAANIIVERVLERQEPEGGWVHLLTEPHCGCYPPRHTGEAGFMVGILLSALRKYHILTGDIRVTEAIAGGARWLIKNTYDEEAMQFRYTNCPNRGQGPGYRFTVYIMEGLTYAAKISDDPTIKDIVKNGKEALRVLFEHELNENKNHGGLGKSITMQSRYMPMLLDMLR